MSPDITSSNVPRLFKWLPDLSAVTSLSVWSGDKKEVQLAACSARYATC